MGQEYTQSASQQFSVLLVAEEGALADLTAGLQAHPQLQLFHAQTAAQAGAFLAGRQVDALLADQHLPDGDGLTLIRRVSQRHPFINTGLVSSLTAGDFHESTEGLGIFVQIPPAAGADFADQVVEKLQKISSLFTSVGRDGA